MLSDFSSLIFIFPSIPRSYLTFSPSQVPVTHFFPFSPSSFFVDTTLFNFYSFHLLIPFTIKSEPFHCSIIVPSYISYINHFPYCQKHYLPFLPNLINFTYSLSFSLLSIFITYLRLQTTLFVSKPLYYSIALRSYISFHFIRRPFVIASFTCITFHFIHQSSHTTNVHSYSYSHSLSIISYPTPFLSIITITFSSHNNLSHCIPALFFLPFVLSFFHSFIPMGEQYSF